MKCPRCGTAVSSQSLGEWDWGTFFVGVGVGAIVVGPFVWSVLGRAVAKTAISAGSRFASRKIEETIRRYQ